MEPVPLGPEDRAILALESPTIAGHTCKVVVTGEGAPDAAALREALAGRIGAAPMLTTRLGGSPDAPAWVLDEDFDLERHVSGVEPSAPLDAAGLRAEVARLFARHLERDRPLWHIDRVPLADGGAALVWRIHHALADGTAAMRYAKALLWDPDPDSPQPPAHPRATADARDDERRRGHLAGFVRREFSRSHGRPPFDGPIGTRREVAFATVALSDLHDAAKALAGATLNDAVLSVVAGALGRWMRHHHGALGSVRVKVPVSLHHEGDDAGNADSFFSVALPLNEPDPEERLRAVQAATAVRKQEHDAEEMDALLAELARVSPRLERLCERVEQSPRAFAVNVSNVPGPRLPVRVVGAPVRSLHSLAEIGERHALRVAVVSFADRLCFGFCADPALVDDVQAMADGVELEAGALVRASAIY